MIKLIVIASEAWQSQTMQGRSVSRGLPRFARNDALFFVFISKCFMCIVVHSGVNQLYKLLYPLHIGLVEAIFIMHRIAHSYMIVLKFHLAWNHNPCR